MRKESHGEFAKRIFTAFLNGQKIICHCGAEMKENEPLVFVCNDCGSTMKLRSKTKPS